MFWKPRSVAVHGSLSGPKFGPPSTLKSFANLGKPSIGIARPPSFGLSKPGPLGIRKPAPFFGAKASSFGHRSSSVGSRASSTESFGAKQEWSGSSVPYTWDVKPGDLNMVPWEFPLERTHRVIEEDATCVAKRISDCLRDLSIEAEFCENAKAKCKTADCVCFRIRLFAGGENGQPVVVEMQRRSGSSSSFVRTCRAVLNAAQGVPSSPVSVREPLGGKFSVSSMKCLAGVIPKEQNFQAQSQAELAKAKDMLRSDQRDSNLLGLESLCTLTDPLKTNPAVSLQISKSVLLDSACEDFREEVRLLTERDEFKQDFDEREPFSNSHNDHIRLLALTFLANALRVCLQDGALLQGMKTQSWFVETLFPSLVEELKRAGSSMNSACKAASCLHSMIKCGASCPVDSSVIEIMEKAREVGRVRHELLAMETRRCLEAAATLL